MMEAQEDRCATSYPKANKMLPNQAEIHHNSATLSPLSITPKYEPGAVPIPLNLLALEPK